MASTGRAPSRNASREFPPNPTRGIAVTRADITTLLSGDPGPVRNATEGRKWLEKKGWVLEEETYDRFKMVSILLTVSLTPKLAPEVSSAIRAAAFLLEDDVTDNISSVLALAVANKVKSHLDNITSELTAATKFLTANSTQQAATTLDLKATADKHASILETVTAELTETTKSLAENSTQQAATTLDLKAAADKHASTTMNLSAISTKISILESTNTQLPTAWGPPNNSNSSSPPPSIPSSNFNPDASAKHSRLQQRIIQAARTVIIDVDPTAMSSPKDRSPEANHKLCEDMNKRLHELDELHAPFDDTNPTTTIRGVKSLERGAFRFDLDSPESATRFKTYATRSADKLLSTFLGSTAAVKTKGYNVIFKFVPCRGSFDPKDRTHIDEIETDNGLSPGDITSSSWLKLIGNRASQQEFASLKVICSTPETANRLLCQRVFVRSHIVECHKDILEAIRCNKCQVYDHMRASCKGTEKCANCASDSHVLAACPSTSTPKCVSCGPNSTHASKSRLCPKFLTKCAALDERLVENTMPYFPTSEPWTWATNPPKLSKHTPAHQPRVDHNAPLPPVENDWSQVNRRRHRQGTLNEFIVHPQPSSQPATQPVLPRSQQPHNNLSNE